MMAQFAEAGKLTRDDLRELEKMIKAREEKQPEKKGRPR
jgi:hypothetical protein